MIRRLLLQNISISQIICYALATFAGLTIVASAVKFYSDVAPALRPDGDENPIFTDTYIVVSKPVTLLGSLGQPASFTADEIDDLRQQPWAADVAAFTPANYSVVASIDFAGRGFATHMFLEAIPDEFIDVKPDGWDFTPGSAQCVPVIIPKDYLALYNFGFATARGLPQITPAMLSQVPLNLTLSGSGGSLTTCARIVGFSSRLNTIAVPIDFINYTNELLAPDADNAPSRLIIRATDTGDPAITRYLEEHDFDTSGADTNTSRATTFLRIVVGILIGIGTVISALALTIMLLSLNLLIQKNRTTLSDLLFLGYPTHALSRRYILLVAGINLTVTLLAIAAVIICAGMWESRLEPLGITAGATLPAGAVACLLMLVLTLLQSAVISRKIKKLR